MENCASARSLNLQISTKQSIEISCSIRYKSTVFAKKLLEDVIAMRKPIKYNKFNKDTGHKKGVGPGRFPQSAAKQFLKLVKSVESNAQDKGLDSSNLKIVKIVPNKASIPMTGGRTRGATKRTHLEIMVAQRKAKSRVKAAKKQVKPEVKKTVVKESEVKVDDSKKPNAQDLLKKAKETQDKQVKEEKKQTQELKQKNEVKGEDQ